MKIEIFDVRKDAHRATGAAFVSNCEKDLIILDKQQAEETATCPIMGKVVENDLVSRCNISGCEHFNIHKSLLQNKEYSHLL